MYAYDLFYEGCFIHEDEGFDTLEEVAKDAFEYIEFKVKEWEEGGDISDMDAFLVKVSGDYGDYDEADYNDLLAILEE